MLIESPLRTDFTAGSLYLVSHGNNPDGMAGIVQARARVQERFKYLHVLGRWDCLAATSVRACLSAISNRHMVSGFPEQAIFSASAA